MTNLPNYSIALPNYSTGLSTTPYLDLSLGSLLDYFINDKPKKPTTPSAIRISKFFLAASLTWGGISTYATNNLDQYKWSPTTLKNINDLYSAETKEIEEAYIKNTTVHEIDEVVQNREEWREDGIIISDQSVHFAKKFIGNSVIGYDLPYPDIDVHPDGQISFTWRKAKMGIMNIAFDENGLATWAAYFEKPERSLRGRFYVKDSMSDSERDLIKKIYNA